MEQYEFDPCDSRDETPLQHKSYQDLIHDLSSYDKDGKHRLERPKNKRCEVCGKSARTPSDLLRHMRVHTGERPFPCVACQKTFKCKRSQLTHQYLSHGIRDGLSDHRLGVLDHRKVKRSSPGTKQQLKSNFCHQVPDLIDQIIHNNYLQQQQMAAFAPEAEKDVQSAVPVVDQDEDTEIVAGEEISNDGGPVSFVGLFGDDLVKKEVEDPAPEEEESPENLRGQSLSFTEDQTKNKDCFPKVPVLRIKTHKCTHCKRQFRSIYTLRYHLRSMHDEKVYLSPALETRLKKRRWIPPHVRLQKSSSTKVSHSKKSFLPTYPNEKIEQKFLSQAEEQQAIDLHVVKKEKAEEDDINNNDGKAENNNGNGTDSKQLPFFGGPSNPFVLPPHIFFPSTPTTDEGLLLNEKPISWESLQVTSDSTLISKLEAVHPVTQQKYVLYKCGLCGKAFASLRVICGHVAVHGQEQPRQDCDKCGASFKWRNELDTHLQCHSSPFLPSYLVNPFPIPVTPFFPMPFPFFALQPSQQMQQQQQNQETDAPSSPHEAEDKTSGVFQCKLCPKTFDRIFSLQRHERIHSGLKACFCKICGRGFSELRNLRHHIIRFHAESTQPLPYRRRPNRMRNVNSSQKLVSFLKKTAVRILNSMSKTDTHTKEDGKSESMKREEQSVARTEAPSVIEHANSSPMPKLFDATSPTQVSPSTDVGEVPPPKLSPEDAKGTEQSIGTTVNGSVEVLQDPKRSLLGNRRKGRPFKLSSKGKHEDVLFSLADSAFLEKSLSECSLLQATEILNGCLKSPELTLPPQLSYLNPEPSSDEPIDMRNPVIRDKNPDPPSTPAFPTAPENNSTLKQPNETTSALKLPEAFESRCLFPCSYCHKSFNSITDINRHMSFHADIRPFKCPYCSYCSRTNSQLKVHMMRHEGIKHYMCQICNYNGVTQSDLNRHLKTRTHLLRSRNVCACCGTGFHTRSLSEEHYKSCHLASQNANESATAPQQPPAPPPTDTKSNRNRVTRLKQFRGGEEAAQIKTEFYQKLCDLNSMGMTLLQQQAASLAPK